MRSSMASIDVARVTDRLGEEEVAELLSALREHLGEPETSLPVEDESAARTVLGGLDETVLDEFMDRLESNDLGCNLYLAVEFEGKIDVGEFSVGSLPTLLDALEEMQDDLDIEDPDADVADDLDADDFESDLELVQAELRNVWRALFQGASEAMDADLALLVVR